MRGASKAFVLFLVGSCFFSSDELMGHGGRFRGPVIKVDDSSGESQQAAQAKGVSFPGGGPQIAFDQSRWEFWWEYNQDPLVNLKPSLFALTPKAGAIDFPYEKVTDRSRTQLVRFFARILREDKNHLVREAAVISLARTHDENALPWIEFAIDDPAGYVRHIAVISLGISQIQGAVPILVSRVNDPNESEEIKSYAAIAVGLVGGDEARKTFQKWLEPKAFKGFKRFVQQGVAFGAGLTEDTSLGPLIRSALHTGLSEDRITTAYLLLSLGRLKDRAANAILLEHLDAKDIQVRRSAVIALGTCASPSDKDVVEAIINKLKTDPDNIMKNFCFMALGQIGGETAEVYLAEQMKEVTRAYLPYVGLALGVTRNPKFGPDVLKAFIATKDLTTRSALAVALGLLKHKEAIGELRKSVDKGGDPIFRGYCALALGMIKDNESVERLTDTYVKANDVELLLHTAVGLGLIGDRSITKEMLAMIDGSAASNVRVATAYNLGLIGDQKMIEPLMQVAYNPKNTIRLRAFALLGLGHLTDTRAIPVVSSITRGNNYTILENFLYELFNVN